MFANARELMNRSPLTVSPEETVIDLAQKIMEAGVEGACVVEDGALVGVVTAMDLIFQEKAVRVPALRALLDALIPMGVRRDDTEFDKIVGYRVRDIMTAPAISVSPGVELEEMATRMVEDHLTILPVVDRGVLVGVVSKWDVLRSSFSDRAAPAA